MRLVCAKNVAKFATILIRSCRVLGAVPLTGQKTSVLSEAFAEVSNAFAVCLSPAFHKEISRQYRRETTIANSIDPLHPRFWPSSCPFPFPKVGRCRHRIDSTKSWLRTPKQRPIDGAGVHLASQIDHSGGCFQ